MNDAKKQEYAKKYSRSGNATRIPKEKNPYPQMKHDSFILEFAPDFGGYGGSTLWTYIYEPVNMQPTPIAADSTRYITLFGGDATNYKLLHGQAEVKLGKTADDLQTFKLDESFGVYIEKGMLYSINITKLDDPKLPMHYSEIIIGADVPPEENPADIPGGYERLIKKGDELDTHYPDAENLDTVMTITHHMFGGKELVRRTWMPIIKPHIMARNSHTHTFSEYLIMLGSNPENIDDLGGVIEFTVGENENELETFRIDKATQFHLQPGLFHSPLVFREVRDPKYPVMLCEVSFTGALVQDKQLENYIGEEGAPVDSSWSSDGFLVNP